MALREPKSKIRRETCDSSKIKYAEVSRRLQTLKEVM